MSWRVESYTRGSRLPTNMYIDDYLPQRNRLDKWCMTPGKCVHSRRGTDFLHILSHWLGVETMITWNR